MKTNLSRDSPVLAEPRGRAARSEWSLSEKPSWRQVSRFGEQDQDLMISSEFLHGTISYQLDIGSNALGKYLNIDIFIRIMEASKSLTSDHKRVKSIGIICNFPIVNSWSRSKVPE